MCDDVIFVARFLEDTMAVGVGALIDREDTLLGSASVEGMDSLYPLTNLYPIGSDILYRCRPDLTWDQGEILNAPQPQIGHLLDEVIPVAP